MDTIFFTSKEDIRARMLRNALDFWGTANVNDLDPFVKLLVEALSSEIFNVSNDVKNLENRILNKLSRILASDHLTSALPAHAILMAQPVEAAETLSTTSHFFYRKPGAVDAAEKSEAFDMFFTPVGNIPMFNAGIRYIFSGRQLYAVDDNMNRTTVATAAPGYSPEQNTLWIGIESNPQLNSLQNAALFFEWPGYTANEEFYNLLSVMKCQLQGQEVELMPGLYYLDDYASPGKPVFYERNTMNQITRDIKDYYNNRFISLIDERLGNFSRHQETLPAELLPIFNVGDVNRIPPCIWLKFTFPAAISLQVIDELQITMNCLPVMNRRLYEQKHRLRNISSIIPVKPGPREHFLSVKALYDDRQVTYQETPYGEADNTPEGSYTIRNGGAERFDTRNARQTIEYLFELLRDEKAAFAAYGNDFLNSTIKRMEQSLALIEKKAQQSHHMAELINYLMVKPYEKSTMMYLQYWTTLADEANHIRRGSRLQQFEMIKFKPDSVRLLSSTVGGRNSLGATERIQAYKYGLITKDRIVTEADLISFCHYELGAKITGVRIAKGVNMSGNPKEGLQKTTDVYLKPSYDYRLSAEEWDTLLTLLHSKLKSRSMGNVNYRLFIES
ncbi:type VI secretion system baseplate subunit TssF [Mucilaginibacter sp.]